MSKFPSNNPLNAAKRSMEKISKLLSGKEFGSKEEMQTFLDNEVNGKRIDEVISKMNDKKPQNKVMDLIDEAYSSPPQKSLKLIDRVLKVDPENPEALILLFQLEEDDLIALEIAKRAVHSSRLRLGENCFIENKGNFWLISETRTFMRAMHNLGQLYLDLAKPVEAMSIFSEMIELNPNDNQGIRDVYAPLLVLRKEYDKYRAVRKLYAEEQSALRSYLYAIYLFRTAGTVPKFYDALRAAYKVNPHFIHITVGIESEPETDVEYYSPGDSNEAYYAMEVLLNLVDDTPGFIYEFGSVPGIKEKIKASKHKHNEEEDLKSIFPISKYFREYVAFLYLAFDTKEGDAFAFFGVDYFSEYAFFLGVESKMNDAVVIEKIKLLTNDTQFITESRPFTLVLDEFENLEKKINRIIKPLGGNVIFSEEFCNKIAEPMIENFNL